MILWHRRSAAPDPAADYPATIPGTLVLRTGDQIELLATLTSEVDDRGIRTYELRPKAGGDRLPVTEADYLAGGISIRVDLIPGRSAMRWGFLQETPPPSAA